MKHLASLVIAAALFVPGFAQVAAPKPVLPVAPAVKVAPKPVVKAKAAPAPKKMKAVKASPKKMKTVKKEVVPAKA